MPRVSLYGAVLLAASAYGAAGGSLRAAVAPLTLWAAIGLTRHTWDGRAARTRSRDEPIMLDGRWFRNARVSHKSPYDQERRDV